MVHFLAITRMLCLTFGFRCHEPLCSQQNDHKGLANMEMTKKYNYMQFLLQNICYIRGAIFITNGLCGIKVISSLHNESSDQGKAAQAKGTSSVVKLEHVKSSSFQIKRKCCYLVSCEPPAKIEFNHKHLT